VRLRAPDSAPQLAGVPPRAGACALAPQHPAGSGVGIQRRDVSRRPTPPTSLHTEPRDTDRHPSRRPSSASARRACALLVASLLALVLAPRAHAAAPLGWGAPASADASGNAPSAIACPSEALCVAVDRGGNVLTSADPAAVAPSWSSGAVDPGQSLNSVACAPAGPCAAVDGEGGVVASAAPGAGAASWSARAAIDGHTAINGVSCPSTSLCLAVDEAGNVLTNTSPGAGGAGWIAAAIDPEHRLLGVSCAGSALCVALDDAGRVLVSTSPAGGKAAWRAPRAIDPALGLRTISCPAAGYCVAMDAAGDALSSANPSASAPTWSATAVDFAGSPTAVSCAASGLCVGVDDHGRAVAGDNPSAPVPAWDESGADPGVALAGISCLPGGFCVAVDVLGRSVTGRVPPPSAVAATPAEVTDAKATLAGVVDPRDAVLGSCSFEYGASAAYGHSVPCTGVPSPAGGPQLVAAPITGLLPNTTYHYRVLAASPVGGGVSGDAVFTTAPSSLIALVYPHPSISGTPAQGQRLTCHAGTTPGASVALTYAWLRDLIPIPAATGSTYQVKGTDTGRHLQCQVSARDGGGSATARSAFVTVPVQGVQAAAGETQVGRARFAHGRLSFAVACSPLASAGCRLTARLTLMQTVQRRRTTVTLAALGTVLSAGQHRTVSLLLTRSAARLLAGRHRLPALLTVSGTVIGVIQASLARQQLLLAAAAGRRTAHLGSTAARAARPSASVPAARTANTAPAPLAPTPYMGWDSYFTFGAHYSESSVLQQASELLSLGLSARGYRYVWLDVGWWHGARAADGQILVNHSQWPHGLAWLTQTLHGAGLRVGLYTDVGSDGCGGGGQGSYGHYQQDANTFAAWGFDAVKVDFCGGSERHLSPAAAYGAFHAAILANSSHRPMLVSICDFLQPGQYAEEEPGFGESAFTSYTFGPSDGNSWRTNTDVGFPGRVAFVDVLRNLDADAAQPQAAGPGHWNDPDYLGPDQGLSAAQFRTQLSMWAVLAAPLMVSDDLTRISSASLAAIRNGDVLAVDQDPAGVQGTLIATAGAGQVWVKPLSDGSRAVALLNRGSSPVQLQSSARAIGMPAAGSYLLRDLWTHALHSTPNAIAARVGSYSTVLLRVYPR
jgi:hypothetical protein